MSIDTGYLRDCILRLEVALDLIGQSERAGDELYELQRASCVEAFDVLLEQSGKLLRKRLAPFFASTRRLDAVEFRDLFRHAAKHGLMEPEVVERWLGYRDCGNDADEASAEAAVKAAPAFVADAKALADMIEAANDG